MNQELVVKIMDNRVAQAAEKYTTWHIMHIFLTCFTGGFWLLAWAFSASRNRRKRVDALLYQELLLRNMINGRTLADMRICSSARCATEFFGL